MAAHSQRIVTDKNSRTQAYANRKKRSKIIRLSCEFLVSSSMEDINREQEELMTRRTKQERRQACFGSKACSHPVWRTEMLCRLQQFFVTVMCPARPRGSPLSPRNGPLNPSSSPPTSRSNPLTSRNTHNNPLTLNRHNCTWTFQVNGNPIVIHTWEDVEGPVNPLGK